MVVANGGCVCVYLIHLEGMEIEECRNNRLEKWYQNCQIVDLQLNVANTT